MRTKKLAYFSLSMIVALVLAACAQPAPMAPADAPAATAPAEEAAAGEAAATGEIVPGGVYIRASNSDASNLNPILNDDTASSDITNRIFPGLLATDAVTGQPTPEGAMAESWTISDDGLVYTFKLRSGITWSDGDPVDAADFKFTYDAVADDQVESPRKYMLEGIESIETPDPLTVVATFSEVNCAGLTNLGLPWLPSHLYAADFSDIMTSPHNEAPIVSAGPLVFQNWTRDDNIALVRNETYWEGAPYMEGMITKVVPDAGARLAQLQSGEIDVLAVQPNQLASIEGDPNITRYQFLDDGYDYIGLNLANPANPQPGLDADGSLVPQEPHPVLGDVRVRQAIAHALDYESIIQNIFLEQGYTMPANIMPAIDWAYDDTIQPYAYDLEQAKALLEEAGWVDGDGDGVREKEGVKLELRLVTNAGNTTREDLGAYAQDQLNSIGFNIDFQAIDFGAMLEQMDAQTFDMYIIGWTNLGSDPNFDESFFGAQYDVPGSGFNNVSFQSARYDELHALGRTVPGCDPADRAQYYKEIQQIFHDELPYIIIRGRVGNYGFNNRWAGLDPQPWDPEFNTLHKWHLAELQP